MPTNKKTLLILSSILLIILAITGYLGYQYFSQTPLDLSAISNKFKAATDSNSKVSPELSPKPIKPIGAGDQTFQFSHSPKVIGPKPQQVILSPIDPQENQSIKITVIIKNDSPVTKADLVIYTDNDTQTKELKLIDGDKTNGTWQAELKLNDTYQYIYKIYFDLQSTTGNYNSGLTLRQ